MIIYFLVCLLIGSFVGMILSDKLDGHMGIFSLFLVFAGVIVLLSAVVFMQIILHEAGHMIAALIRGWTFVSFMFLNFIISRKDGRLHLSRYGIPGAGGQCIMMPPPAGDTDFGVAFYNAGGFLMNALLGIVSAVLLILFYDELGIGTTLFLFLNAVVGFTFALTNAVPMTAGGLPNDGSNMMVLRKDRFSTDVFFKSIRVLGMLQEGHKLEDVLTSYICDDKKLRLDNPIHAMALNMDLSLALSTLNFTKAREITQRALKGSGIMVSIYLNEFKKERLFLALLMPEEGTDARTLIDDDIRNMIKTQSAMRPDIVRVEYAVALLLDKDEDKAAEIYDKFERLCARHHSQGDVISERKLVGEIRRVRDAGINA